MTCSAYPVDRSGFRPEFPTNKRWASAVSFLLLDCTSKSGGTEIPEPLGKLIRQTCPDCHDGESSESDFDLLAFRLGDQKLYDRTILIDYRNHAERVQPDPRRIPIPFANQCRALGTARSRKPIAPTSWLVLPSHETEFPGCITASWNEVLT